MNSVKTSSYFSNILLNYNHKPNNMFLFHEMRVVSLAFVILVVSLAVFFYLFSKNFEIYETLGVLTLVSH